MMSSAVPLIGLPMDVKTIEDKPFHAVGEKYINAVVHGAKGFPVMLPAMGEGKQLQAIGERFDLSDIVGQLDGLFLPGSVANMAPERYGQTQQTPDLPRDPQRDETTLQLVKLALEFKIPLLGACRGFQEINVALGGTLHQQVHTVPGYMDHREDAQASTEEQYQLAHEIQLAPNGLLASLANSEVVSVNSLHGQGIDRLAEGLEVEARAPDGLIEAFRLANTSHFVLGVQWHPEWRIDQHPFYASILTAFGDAVRQRHQQRCL